MTVDLSACLLLFLHQMAGLAQRLAHTSGAFTDASLSYVGAKGNVQLWRADIPTVHGLPLLSLPGLHWQTEAGMQLWESWRRAYFDALRLFGLLPHNEGSVSVVSLAALAASAPSASLLPELKTAQQHNFFLQQVAKGVDGLNRLAGFLSE